MWEESRPTGTPEARGTLLIIDSGPALGRYIVGPSAKHVQAHRISTRVYKLPDDAGDRGGPGWHAFKEAIRRKPGRTAALLAELFGSVTAACAAWGPEDIGGDDDADGAGA